MAMTDGEFSQPVEDVARENGKPTGKTESHTHSESETSSNTDLSPESSTPPSQTEEEREPATLAKRPAATLQNKRSVRELLETRETPSKMDVGHGVFLKATIKGADLVIIRGMFEGEIKAQCVDIEQGAEVKGTIECEAARVNGTFDGELVSAHSLHLASHGNVSGRIVYRRLKIAKGAQLYGHAVYRSPVHATK